MEFGKRHDTSTDNGLLPAPTCHRLVVYVADLLETCCRLVVGACYGETGVMDFGLMVPKVSVDNNGDDDVIKHLADGS